MEAPVGKITKNAGDEASVVANNVRAGEGNWDATRLVDINDMICVMVS